MFQLVTLALSSLALASPPCVTTPEQALSFLQSKKVAVTSLDRLTSLDFGGGTPVTDDELVNLCGLTGLKSLYLYQDSVQDTSLTGRTLDQLAGLKNVAYLDLDSNRITADHLEKLEGMTALTTLKLFNNPLAQNPRGLAAIDGLLKVPSLKTLVLQGSARHHLTDADVPALANLADHPALETLELSGNEISGRASFFEAVGQIKNLRRLSLVSVGLKPGANFGGLARSGVRNLALNSNSMFGGKGNVISADELRTLRGLQLKYIGLDATGIDPRALEVLAELKSLEQIDLAFNPLLTPESVQKLIADLPKLTCIKMDQNVLDKIDKSRVRDGVELGASPIRNMTCQQN